jgi:hypothetical protein
MRLDRVKAVILMSLRTLIGGLEAMYLVRTLRLLVLAFANLLGSTKKPTNSDQFIDGSPIILLPTCDESGSSAATDPEILSRRRCLYSRH